MNTEIEKYNFLGVSVSSFSKNQLIEHIKFTVNSNQTNILYGYSLGIFFWIKRKTKLTPSIFKKCGFASLYRYSNKLLLPCQFIFIEF
jgi:hypothetical protein